MDTLVEDSLNGAQLKPQPQAKRFPVMEIFGPVIQGEGQMAGTQTMFIRFGGCDYRCKKCDSLHAVLPQLIKANATYMTTSEILEMLVAAAEKTGVRWVTFSGGNPCMHQLGELVNELNRLGWYINVETQGTLWQDWLPYCSIVTVSPKGFGMGEKFEDAKYLTFIGRLHAQVPLCVKVVAFSSIDLEFAFGIWKMTQEVVCRWPPGMVTYYLSLGNPYPLAYDHENNLIPEQEHAGGSLASRLLKDYKDLSEEILRDFRLKPFRFLPQLHVLVYGNEQGR